MKIQVVYAVIMILTVGMLAFTGILILRENRILARAKSLTSVYDPDHDIEYAMIKLKTTQSWRRIETNEQGSRVEVWLKWHDKSYVDAAQKAGLLQAVETAAARGKPAPKAKMVARSGNADMLMILPEDYLRVEFFVPEDKAQPAKIAKGEVYDRKKNIKQVRNKDVELAADDIDSVLYTGFFLHCPEAIRAPELLARAKQMPMPNDASYVISAAIKERKAVPEWRTISVDDRGSRVEVWLKWQDKSYVDAAQKAGLLETVDVPAERAGDAPKKVQVAKGGNADVLMILPEDYLRIELFVPAVVTRDAKDDVKIVKGEVYDHRKTLKQVKGKAAELTPEVICAVLSTGRLELPQK